MHGVAAWDKLIRAALKKKGVCISGIHTTRDNQSGHSQTVQKLSVYKGDAQVAVRRNAKNVTRMPMVVPNANISEASLETFSWLEPTDSMTRILACMTMK